MISRAGRVVRPVRRDDLIPLAIRTALLTGAVALLLPGTVLGASPVPVEPASDLVGHQWLLTGHVAEDGDTAGAAAPAFIHFDETAFTGDTGCAAFAGSWAGTGGGIVLTDVVITPAACDPTAVAQDMALQGALDDITGYAIAGGALDLLDASGAARLTYGSPEGRTWVPLMSGDQPTPDAVVTLSFLDQIACGQAPCNQFSGPYTLDGATLVMGPLATTMRACPDSALEQRYLDALTSAASSTLESGDLVLLDASAAELARFAPASTGD